MPRIIVVLIVASLLLVFHGLGAAYEPMPAEATTNPEGGSEPRSEIENVFIVIIDGIRNSEAFEHPMHVFIPRIWNDLRPLGTIYSSFVNAGHTATSAGHGAITSGVTQFIPNTLWFTHEDIVRIQEEPSLFQYYRKQRGIPEDKTWIINGKGGMIEYVGISQHPSFRGDFAPSLSFHDLVSDDTTWAEAERVIDTYHPSLAMINLADVDEYGHTGNWKLYTQAIRRADQIVYDLCQKIWSDPFYDGNTAIFITSDHGRHLDGVFDGFKEHGCSCMGCRAVPFLAIGPGIKQDAVVSKRGFLRDIAPTVACMLDFDVHLARGRILRDLFETPPAGEPMALVDPVVAAAADKTHVAACLLGDMSGSIAYSYAANRGSRREGFAILSGGTTNFSPSIAALDDRVAVAWTCGFADGSYRIAARESTDNGSSWNEGIVLDGQYPYWEDLFPCAFYSGNELRVVWTEARISRCAVNMAVIRDGEVVRTDTFYDVFTERPRCSAGPGGTHAVFQRLDGTEKNFDIRYCFHDDNGWLPSVNTGATIGESLRPDVVADSNGIHLVWGENDNSLFRLMSRRSAEGTVWSDSVEIGSSGFGAWRPRLAAANGKLLTVWEGYDNDVPGIFASSSADSGATWSTAVRLTPPEEVATNPAMVIDEANVLHLVWMKGSQPTRLGWMHLQL